MSRSAIRLLGPLFTAVSMGLIAQPACPQSDGDPVTLGTYRVLHSEILDEERVLQVFLPPGYGSSALHYPVLYLFYSDQVTLYFAEAVNAVSTLSDDLMPQVILVGVANVDRYRDLYPWPRPDGWGGNAESFIRFVRQELIPFVDGEYRTQDYRIMVGPQAASVFGAYALLEDPDLFQAFILNDPCRIDSEERSLCERVGSFAASPPARGTFFSVSHDAGEERWALDRLTALERSFHEKAADGFRWRITLDPSWALFLAPLHLRENLLALFPGYRFSPHEEVTGLTEVLTHFAELSRRYGFQVDPPDLVLSQISDRLSGQGKYVEALEVLNHLMALYPASGNGVWRLANLHREMGDTATAIRYYRECLEWDPNMTPARVWLERLGGR